MQNESDLQQDFLRQAMKRHIKIWVASFLLMSVCIVPSLSCAGSPRGPVAESTSFDANTTYSVCFTPGQDCEGLIVNEIRLARESILVQAYSFTSTPIAKALADAKKRGVDVRAILDKSQRTEKYSGATFLNHAGIPIAIDVQPAIAHNKVMVFDQQTVLTGSFNFTKAAQERNAENFILIKGDANLVQAYTKNWLARWKVSVTY